MSEYTPELGQAVFGQPYKEFEVPEIMDAALQYIRYELERVRWNIRQQRDPDPFGNYGAEYKNDTFHAVSYSWSDEEQPYNFKWSDLEISWYKYMGRGMSANQEIDPNLAAQCLEECLESLRAWEKEHSLFEGIA